jgi:hypothetical protein
MIRFALPFAVGLTIASAAFAQAGELQSIARQCAEEIEEEAGCTTACTNETWPAVARCVNAKLKTPMAHGIIERCIRQTQKTRPATACQLCGDPVAEVFLCADG